MVLSGHVHAYQRTCEPFVWRFCLDLYAKPWVLLCVVNVCKNTLSMAAAQMCSNVRCLSGIAACSYIAGQAWLIAVCCKAVPHPSQHGCCRDVCTAWFCSHDGTACLGCYVVVSGAKVVCSRTCLHLAAAQAVLICESTCSLLLSWHGRAHGLVVLQALCTNRHASPQQLTAVSVPPSTSPTAMQVSSFTCSARQDSGEVSAPCCCIVVVMLSLQPGHLR